MPTTYQLLTPGPWATGNRYTAPSDGFVNCFIKNTPNALDGSVGWGYAYCRGVWAQATGGNAGNFSRSWTRFKNQGPQSCLLPVGAGDPFYVGFQLGPDFADEAHAPYFFHWISPTGQSCGAPVLGRSLGDSDFEPPPAPQVSRSESPDRAEFVAILEELLGKPIDAATKKRLAGLRL
jgi:hypothetical protein